MMPTLRTPLGGKGPRPVVGHLDCPDVRYVFGALTLVTGRVTTRLGERPRPSTLARSKQRDLQAAYARHLREIARASPAAHAPRVVVVSDHASWPRGAVVTAVLRACPPLECDPLPSYSPKLQGMARFWTVLRRRATPNRLVPPMAQLKRTVRNNLRYSQTRTHRVLSVIQSARKRTKSSAA
jgi:hypothetical protein